jgi:hypothetical protein
MNFDDTAHNLPSDNPGYLDPNNPDAIREIMDYTGCDEKTARRILEKLLELKDSMD